MRTWRRDSSERRKNPRREGSGDERVEATETPETLTVTWPVCVNPNFSKRIMGRESAVMVRVLISAVTKGRRRRRTEKEKMERTWRNVRGVFIIVADRKRKRCWFELVDVGGRRWFWEVNLA